MWMNPLGLSDMGEKVAGDVHGVGPLGIPQALGFPSSSHVPQAVTRCCGTVGGTLTLISEARGSCDSIYLVFERALLLSLYLGR